MAQFDVWWAVGNSRPERENFASYHEAKEWLELCADDDEVVMVECQQRLGEYKFRVLIKMTRLQTGRWVRLA